MNSILGPAKEASSAAEATTAFEPQIGEADAPLPQSDAAEGEADGDASGGDVASRIDSAVVFLNHAGKIVAANPSCSAFFGWEEADLVGQHLQILLQAGSGSELEAALSKGDGAAHAEGGLLIEVVARRKLGGEFPAQVALKWRPRNRWFCWTVAFQDRNRDVPPQPQAAEGIVSEPPLTTDQSQPTPRHSDEAAQLEDLSTGAVAPCPGVPKENTNPPAAGPFWQNSRLLSRFHREAGAPPERTGSEANEANGIHDGRMLNQLGEKFEDFKAANADLGKRLTELGHSKEHLLKVSAEFERQLGEAKADLNYTKRSLKDEEARRSQVEQELARLREERDELAGQVVAQEEATAESDKRLRKLEERLRHSVAELERARNELEQQYAEEVRLQSECQNLANAKEALDTELCCLRDTAAAREAEFIETERRAREGAKSLECVTADLEKEREERRRIEQRADSLAAQAEALQKQLEAHCETERLDQARIGELEQQLQESQEALTRTRADLQNETATRELAEEELKAITALSNQLSKDRACLEEARKALQRTEKNLEARIEAGLGLFNQTPAPAQDETQTAE